MGMVMRNHELVESVAYPYGFATEVDAWREVAEDRDSDVSASISIDAFELSGYGLNPSPPRAMGMVMRNHELVESVAYPYGFATEVDAWREVAEDRDSDVSASISIDAFELSGYLDPSVDLAG
ncbi:hypothetical protein AYI68_g3662 [Smittium mucronatum]|uniref:Uncharacterized protein n=1 Tax=Smittium mucronatum TaxID=133383 RepID=A0A1R0GZ90_9FUNG|nr:hypothetical protein AYI68_g3662 [Smittium mucronatum]